MTPPGLGSSPHNGGGELAAVQRADAPATVTSLRRDLEALPLEAGAPVLVHSSLSALGWVAGGSQSVVQALVDSIDTLVMPTHSGHLSEPSRWRNPPVPESWWPTIRDELPGFDPAVTPTFWMGAIVECFRRFPGVTRSSHPTVSFAAVGPKAREIVDGHSLEYGLGEESPLGRLYELDGYVLLMGVGFDSCTALHLAEHRAEYPGKDWFEQGSPMIVNGKREWVTYPDLDGDTDDFEQLGDAFGAAGSVIERPIGVGRMRLIRIRELVDFAVVWFESNRNP